MKNDKIIHKMIEMKNKLFKKREKHIFWRIIGMNFDDFVNTFR